MKDELNNYNIANADGASVHYANDGKVSFDNDNPGYIRESVAEQSEFTTVAETYDDPMAASEDDSSDDYNDVDMSSTSSASSSASSASSSVASASASVGGGLGALAGVVAASVAAAVVVVAVFVSTLAINLSLLMADMHSLAFEVVMTGADEKDFDQPIYAILTGDDTYREQEVTQDTRMLVFDDLEPGKDYRLVVKREDKVFADVVAATATQPADNGEIISHMQGNDVFVTVQNAKLKATEHYTLLAKDADGNVVFSRDGVEPYVEYSFVVDEPKDLYFYLVVGGKTYAISQIALPDYDFAHGLWSWAEDNLSATVTFADKRGGDDLVLEATVTRKSTDASCDKDGSVVYTARATYEGKAYTDKQTVVIESEGHNYEGTYEGGHITYTCTRCGDTYTDAD